MRKEAIAADKEREDAAAIAKVKANEVKAADEGMVASEGHASPKEQEAEPLSAEPLSAADETFRTQVR